MGSGGTGEENFLVVFVVKFGIIKISLDPGFYRWRKKESNGVGVFSGDARGHGVYTIGVRLNY